MSRPKRKPAEFLSTCNVDVTEMKKREVMWAWLMRAFWSHEQMMKHEFTKPVENFRKREPSDLNVIDEDELVEYRETEKQFNFEKQEIMEFLKTVSLSPVQKEIINRHCFKFESWNQIADSRSVRRDTVIKIAVEATEQICSQL